MPVRLVVVVATLAGLTGGALAGSAAAKARYPQGLWTGITYGNNYSKFTFRLSGNRVTKFVDRAVGCNAFPGGYQTQTITFPGGVKVGSSGSFHEVRRPVKGTTDTLKGTIKGDKASGTLVQAGVCDTGSQPWVAKPGKMPPKAPKTHLSKCSRSACPATDGLVFHVTGVDTTLTSIQNPNAGPFSNTIDPGLSASGGGVLVTLTASNPTGSAISIATPNEFTLLDGAAGHDADRDETGYDVVTQDGRIATNANTCDSEAVEVPPKGHSGTVTLCFAVPAAARKAMNVLFDYPTTMAKIPLQ
jgi:hypothetical protein